MTKTDYFRRANEITEWTRLGMITQEEATKLNLVLELDRIRAVGHIRFASAGAVRKPIDPDRPF